MSTGSEVVLDEIGAIATEGHVRRIGERGEKLLSPGDIRACRIDGGPGEPSPAVGTIWNPDTGTWAMGNHERLAADAQPMGERAEHEGQRR